MTLLIIEYLGLIGTVAFAISGAILAVRKKMDAFGVNILAVIASTGGGILRDLIIGRTPPVMFSNPIYVVIAVITANVVFLYLYITRKRDKQKGKVHRTDTAAYLYEKCYFWFDTLGLAAFSVDGARTGFHYPMDSLFLVVFLGTVTGVGGGILRDICADKMPDVFVRHIYALASLLGALTTGVLLMYVGTDEPAAAVCGAAVVILIRVLASHYKWNFPRVS